MRVAQLLSCPIFLWFAYLQLNDHDAARWILVYGLVAASCAAGALGRPSSVVSIVLTIVLVAWAAVLSMDISEILLKPSAPQLIESEEARELGGLLVAALWCALSAIYALRRRWRAQE